MALASSNEQLGAVAGEFSVFDGNARSTAAMRVFQVNPKAYYFIIQALLSKRELYKGNPGGRLDAATVSALSKLCKAENLTRECSKGPTSAAAINAIAKVL